MVAMHVEKKHTPNAIAANDLLLSAFLQHERPP
jgi:hypothetical protein